MDLITWIKLKLKEYQAIEKHKAHCPCSFATGVRLQTQASTGNQPSLKHLTVRWSSLSDLTRLAHSLQARPSSIKLESPSKADLTSHTYHLQGPGFPAALRMKNTSPIVPHARWHSRCHGSFNTAQWLGTWARGAFFVPPHTYSLVLSGFRGWTSCTSCIFAGSFYLLSYVTLHIRIILW